MLYNSCFILFQLAHFFSVPCTDCPNGWQCHGAFALPCLIWRGWFLGELTASPGRVAFLGQTSARASPWQPKGSTVDSHHQPDHVQITSSALPSFPKHNCPKWSIDCYLTLSFSVLISQMFLVLSWLSAPFYQRCDNAYWKDMVICKERIISDKYSREPRCLNSIISNFLVFKLNTISLLFIQLSLEKLFYMLDFFIAKAMHFS